MAGSLPISTTRTSDYASRTRLMQQVQNDQTDLFRLQRQISTGRRIFLPSDDSPASTRVMSLQRLLEERGQLQTNLNQTQSFLAASDTGLSTVSSILIEVRAATLGVVGTVATDTERKSIGVLVQRSIEQILRSGNTSFRDRYLFAGGRASEPPYQTKEGYIEYTGNEVALRTYVDLDSLFETNISGNQVFGSISNEVLSGSDLNPHVHRDTKLSSLNGGFGVSKNGSILITGSTGTTSTIDLSKAATLEDVIKAIEANAPAGHPIRASLSEHGLNLTTTAGTIVVSESGAGATAQELGLLGNPAAGTDLNPKILPITELHTLLGSKAQAEVRLAGQNNDLRLTANLNGAQFNNTQIIFVDNGISGSETALFTAGVTPTLTISIANGATTSEGIRNAINAEGTFKAELDLRDITTPTLIGKGTITEASYPITLSATSDGSGTPFDTSGISVQNGGSLVPISFNGAETVEDILNILNHSDLGLLAEINSQGTGINVRSRRSGADLKISENGGNTALQLGIRTFTSEARLEDFNRGLGVPTVDITPSQSAAEGYDFSIIATDGTIISLDISSANTVGSLVNQINSHGANGGKVIASLAADGNGIQLSDTVGGVTNALTIRSENESKAAEYLGFITKGETQTVSTGTTLKSEHRISHEVDGVFNSLIRLQQALEKNDTIEIGRSVERLDHDLNRVNSGRGEVGYRARSLDILETHLQDEEVQLKADLSEDLDVDLADAISKFTARQFALQASLKTVGNILQLTLLDYI